jgi:site-specific DNA recombinase
MVNTGGVVALVARISEDKSGRVEGVRNQERWGRAYAGRTWPGVPVEVFADNHLSASDDTVRPEFERFRQWLADGRVAHVWAVEQSRLERREAEWFGLAAELDAAGISEVHTQRDGIVRVRDEVAGIKAVLNAAEVRKLKRRVNERLDENAARGRPSGSRPFGYRHGVTDTGDKTLSVVEEEAAIIVESADRFLAGWSLANIARELRARGVTGPYLMKVTASGRRYTRARGASDPVITEDGTPIEDGGVPLTRPGTITANSVRSWLTSPTIAGRRVHRGVDVGAGNWPAILDADVFAAVQHRLAAPRRVTTVHGAEYEVQPTRNTPARRYLLSGGTLACGICGAPLIGTMKQRRKSGRLLATVPYYTCHPKAGGRGCVGVLADPVDALVVETLLAALDKPEFRAAMLSDESAERRREITKGLEALDRRRRVLAAKWAAGDLSDDEWEGARATLIERVRALRAELAQLPAPAGRVDLDGLREAWGFMTLDERREIIGMFIDRVTVGRARPGLHTFDPERLSPPETWWRTQ